MRVGGDSAKMHIRRIITVICHACVHPCYITRYTSPAGMKSSFYCHDLCAMCQWERRSDTGTSVPPQDFISPSLSPSERESRLRNSRNPSSSSLFIPDVGDNAFAERQSERERVSTGHVSDGTARDRVRDDATPLLQVPRASTSRSHTTHGHPIELNTACHAHPWDAILKH